MKLSELVVGKEYAVVPSWTYSSRSARDVNNVRENDVVKATLLSKDKYEYEPSNRKSTATDFTKASEGNRSVGVLVKATDKSGSDIYWTTRLADIVAVYSDLEPKWKTQKAEQDKIEQELKERERKEQEHKERIFAEVERSRNSVVQTTRELLGDKASVRVDTTGYGLDFRGVVTISLAEFEKLVELSYAGKDLM